MGRPSILTIGGTQYWAIYTYDTAGELVDADSTPTVAVRKNGASTGDSVTVTKRTATTGIYDCSYNPASESIGDVFTIDEVATISAVNYSNVWNFTIIDSYSSDSFSNTINNNISAMSGGLSAKHLTSQQYILSTSGNLSNQNTTIQNYILGASGGLNSDLDRNYSSILASSGVDRLNDMLAISGGLSSIINAVNTSVISTSGDLKSRHETTQNYILSASGGLNNQHLTTQNYILASSGTDRLNELLATSGALQASINNISVITPVSVAVSAGEVSKNSVTYYYREGKSLLLTITDTNSSPVDMSSKTLVFVAEKRDKTDLFAVSGASISVGGGSNNQVTIVVSSGDTTTIGEHRYALRDSADNNRVWARGTLTIDYEPIV